MTGLKTSRHNPRPCILALEWSISVFSANPLSDVTRPYHWDAMHCSCALVHCSHGAKNLFGKRRIRRYGMEYVGHRRYGMEYVVLRRQQDPLDINKPRLFQPLYLDDATHRSYHKPLLQNGQTIRWSTFDWASNWTIRLSTFGRASQKTTLVLIETYQNKNYENVVDWICFRKFFFSAVWYCSF